ncbi:hypothetical protein JCM10049v2_006824 [Rhodotorula toruloides]
MPSHSSLTSSEKSLIKKHAPTSSGDKIHSAAIGRIYYAFPDPTKWSYSGISGAVVFGWGQAGGWLKVVDLAGTRGVVWQHTVVEDMPYYQDRTFFHTFPSDDCMIGIAFSSESEAADLFKKISLRHKYASKFSSSSSAPSSSKTTSSSPSKKKKKGGIDKSMIGAPTGFSHVAHMGFDSEKGFSSRNIDPSWERLFQQLESQGISRDQIEKNEHFIRNFVEGSGGPTASVPPSRTSAPSAPPPPPPPLNGPPSRAPPPPAPASSKRVPPPAPPSRAPGGGGATAHAVKRKPPPPPSRGAPAPAPAAPSSAPPPPPPPPPGGAPPSRSAHPQPPSRTSAPSPPPPPPPPPPPGGAAPPPPPPPIAAGGGDERGALLASIQGMGVNKLKKTDKSAIENAGSLAAMGIVGAGVAGAASIAVASSAPAADSGGGDLASALAAALSQRKGNMGGESDEEGEGSDDEDW